MAISSSYFSGVLTSGDSSPSAPVQIQGEGTWTAATNLHRRLGEVRRRIIKTTGWVTAASGSLSRAPYGGLAQLWSRLGKLSKRQKPQRKIRDRLGGYCRTVLSRVIQALLELSDISGI